jgi:hypothetical protein
MSLLVFAFLFLAEINNKLNCEKIVPRKTNSQAEMSEESITTFKSF